MKTLIQFLVVAAALSNTACTNPRLLQASPANSATPIYENGQAILESTKTNTVVVRVLTPQFDSEIAPTVFVGVSNGTAEPIDFTTANITATDDGRELTVYSAEQVEAKIKRDAMWAAIATGLDAAAKSYNAAAASTSYTSGSAYAYGTGGSAYGTYSGVTTTYDPAATAAAQASINASSQAQMTAIAAATDAQLAGTASLLRRTTVLPGKFAGGGVVLDDSMAKGSTIALTVDLGTEQHKFLLDVR